MCITLMSEIWNNESLELTLTETTVLLKLADYAAADGTGVYPSLTTLSKKIRISIRGLRNVTDQLIKKKLIQKKVKGSKYRTNSYTLNVPKICRPLFLDSQSTVDLYSKPDETLDEILVNEVDQDGARGALLDKTLGNVVPHHGARRAPNPLVNPLIKKQTPYQDTYIVEKSEDKDVLEVSHPLGLEGPGMTLYEYCNKKVSKKQLQKWVVIYGSKHVKHMISLYLKNPSVQNAVAWIGKGLNEGWAKNDSDKQIEPGGEQISPNKRKGCTMKEKIALWDAVDESGKLKLFEACKIHHWGIESSTYDKVCKDTGMLYIMLDTLWHHKMI